MIHLTNKTHSNEVSVLRPPLHIKCVETPQKLFSYFFLGWENIDTFLKFKRFSIDLRSNKRTPNINKLTEKEQKKLLAINKNSRNLFLELKEKTSYQNHHHFENDDNEDITYTDIYCVIYRW